MCQLIIGFKNDSKLLLYKFENFMGSSEFLRTAPLCRFFEKTPIAKYHCVQGRNSPNTLMHFRFSILIHFPCVKTLFFSRISCFFFCFCFCFFLFNLLFGYVFHILKINICQLVADDLWLAFSVRSFVRSSTLFIT